MRFAARSERSRFKRLSLEQLDGLYNFALHQSPDSATAEELVLETYARAGSQIEQLPDEANFKLWIFKILRNEAVRRRKNGWPKRVASETSHEIDPALAGLPETPRLALVLFAVEEFTWGEITDILDSRPPNHVWLDTAGRRLGFHHRPQFS